MAEGKSTPKNKKNIISKLMIAVVFILLFSIAVVLNNMWDKVSPDNLPNTIIQTSTAKEEFSEKLSGT